MRIHWKTYQDAHLELVWDLLPGDKRYTGYLICYGNTADISSTPLDQTRSPTRCGR